MLQKSKKRITLALITMSTLIMLLSTGLTASANTITDTKWVEDQPSQNYNDGKYKGTLSKYVESSRDETMSDTGFSWRNFSCVAVSGGATWQAGNQTETGLPLSIDYNSGGYVGTLIRHSTTLINVTSANKPCSAVDHIGNHYVLTHTYRADYAGLVQRHRWKGMVEATVEDPSNDKEEPGTTEGRASGTAYWELVRNDTSKASDVVDAHVNLTTA